MAIRQAVPVPCVRSCAAPALGTWMCSSPEIPQLFMKKKKVNPRPLISVFLKSRHSVLLHLYPLFKDPHCSSARNHLRSAPSLLQSHFAFPLHSYSSKQRWVVGWWDGGDVLLQHPGCQVWSTGLFSCTPTGAGPYGCAWAERCPQEQGCWEGSTGAGQAPASPPHVFSFCAFGEQCMQKAFYFCVEMCV